MTEKEEVWALMRLYALRKIDKDEFISSYSKRHPITSDYCLELLKTGLTNKDAGTIEEALAVTGIADLISESFTEILCGLLHKEWHYSHEVIAMDLRDLRSPVSIDCLYKAAELSFEYLNYDDTYQFARKCIKALSAIGNKSAIDKLNKLAESETLIISEYAKKELGYLGVL